MFSVSLIKPKMAVCGVSSGREIIVRNTLKWFHSCLAHMHSKNTCLIVSSYEWQNKYRGVYVLPKAKSILFRYDMLWSIIRFCCTKSIRSDLLVEWTIDTDGWFD